ncbi:cytochrome P450 [Thermoascus aurantiacus ATCC 26904]
MAPTKIDLPLFSLAGSLLDNPLALLGYSALVLAVGYVLYQRSVSPLAKIPGPFWASISRLWITKHAWDGDIHRTVMTLHAQHGKLVRTGPNEVSVSDLAAIKTIYGAGTKFRKSDWYSVWQGRRKFDLFAERDEAVHGRQRKLVSNIYAMSSLKELEKWVDDAVEVFMRRMEDQGSRTVDLGKWLQLFAFDVIGEITFSKRFGFLDMGEDDGSFAQIEGALRSASWVGQVPWVYWLNDLLTPLIGNHLGIAARHGKIRQFAAREIASRKDRGSDHRDMLAKLFEVGSEKGKDMSDDDVLSMATSNIFAGSDTTAISLRAIIYYLLKNPERMARLMEEMENRRREGRLSDPVKLSEAMNMPYLQACMYEALRLHPAVGMSLPRVVPKGGITVDGRFIPEETIIGVNPWVVHRDTSVYGDDVEEFRPERWLGKEKGDMERFFFAFGAGARLCIGKSSMPWPWICGFAR